MTVLCIFLLSEVGISLHDTHIDHVISDVLHLQKSDFRLASMLMEVVVQVRLVAQYYTVQSDLPCHHIQMSLVELRDLQIGRKNDVK